VLRDVPRPELDDVSGRVGDVRRTAVGERVEAMLLRLVSVHEEAIDRCVASNSSTSSLTPVTGIPGIADDGT
jgi:hypothetical protein